MLFFIIVQLYVDFFRATLSLKFFDHIYAN